MHKWEVGKQYRVFCTSVQSHSGGMLSSVCSEQTHGDGGTIPFQNFLHRLPNKQKHFNTSEHTIAGHFNSRNLSSIISEKIQFHHPLKPSAKSNQRVHSATGFFVSEMSVGVRIIMKCLEKMATNDYILEFCPWENARNCLNSDNVRQKICKMALSWTHRNQ